MEGRRKRGVIKYDKEISYLPRWRDDHCIKSYQDQHLIILKIKGIELHLQLIFQQQVIPLRAKRVGEFIEIRHK